MDLSALPQLLVGFFVVSDVELSLETSCDHGVCIFRNVFVAAKLNVMLCTAVRTVNSSRFSRMACYQVWWSGTAHFVISWHYCWLKMRCSNNYVRIIYSYNYKSAMAFMLRCPRHVDLLTPPMCY